MVCQIAALDDPESAQVARERLQYLKKAPYISLLCLLTETLYMSYRIFLFRSVASVSFTSYLFLSIEICFALAPLLLNLQNLSAIGKAKPIRFLRAKNNDVPSVDVLVPCCGEDIDLIADTVITILNIDYPVTKCRIVVLDDANEHNVRLRIEDLANKYQRDNLHYTAREKTSPLVAHSKAGNLNHGLEYVKKLSGGAAEYVAVLDSDMMTRPDWLRTMVAPLLLDPKVAMAQPPQRYYNIPTADPFLQNLDIVFDGLEPVKSCASAVWCYGSGYVVRRQAMEQIDGYPTENICDDLLVSVRIIALGWKIVYVHEDVQWGLVPMTIPAFIGQQRRWFLGSLYSIESLWNSRAKGVAPVGQQVRAGVLCLASAILYPVLALTIIVMPWLLISESEIVTYNTRNQLRTLLLLQCASFASDLLSGYYRARQAGFACQILTGSRQLGLTPYHLVTLVKFLTPRGVENLIMRALRPLWPAFLKQGGYRSSNSSQIIKERRSGIQYFHFALLSAIIISNLSGVVHSVVRCFSNSNGSRMLFWVTHAGYPPVMLFWTMFIVQVWIQLYHLLFCRQIWPSRERLLLRVSKDEPPRLSPEATDRRRIRPSQAYPIIAAMMQLGIAIFAFVL